MACPVSMPRMRRRAPVFRLPALLLTVVLLLLYLPPPARAGTVSTEYKLKAALVYKLTRFVEWPEKASLRPDGTFGVCVLGRDDFGRALDALAGRSVDGAPISVHRFSQSRDIDGECQVVFISDSKKAFLEPIVAALEKRAVLTLGDSERFAERGGMIQFVSRDRRIGFTINLRHVHAAGLRIAAPLLELATIIGNGAGGGRP